MQSEGSEWRRLHFNSGGIRGKKEAGFTKGTGFFCLCPAAARAQSIMSAVRCRAHACRAGGAGGAPGRSGPAGPRGRRPARPRLAHREPRPAAAAADPATLARERSKDRTKREHVPQKASEGGRWEAPPTCPRSPQHHGSRAAPSPLSPGPSLAGPALSLACLGLPWLLPRDPAPSLAALAPSLVTLVLPWCGLVLLWWPLLLP